MSDPFFHRYDVVIVGAGGAGLMAADGPRVMDADGGDGLTDDVDLQSAPHHLDFG